MQFAVVAHDRVTPDRPRGQRRKYTGDPYIVHPIAVADLVRQVGGNEDMIAAAYLHDVIEDCGVTFQELQAVFNSTVAVMVLRLSDLQTPAYGNRAFRKASERAKLATAGPSVQTIKLADLIDNTNSITAHDPDFAVAYLREKRELLAVMTAGDKGLWALAARLAGMPLVG
jgi:(p)ppGpp synthase/HD superfamily hydrolase